MRLKSIFQSIHCRLRDYNLFIPNENDYDDEEQQQQDPIIALRDQQYSTRVYLLLLIVCMYILFYNAMINPQVHTVIFTDINFNRFSELNSEYGDNLSCPCSVIITSYQTFVSNTIIFHPICSSFFVSQQWIDALYLSDRSRYGIGDFRTTAVSQFQLLSSLCSISQDLISRTKIDLNDKEFTTTFLLQEAKIELEIDAITQSFQNDLSNQIISFIDYIRLITETNNFVTSLNTNAYFFIDTKSSVPTSVNVSGRFEYYDPQVGFGNPDFRCNIANPITSAAFHINNTMKDYSKSHNRDTWRIYPPNATIVKGFFAACTPLEAILKSTLDCLYDVYCLQLLTEHFPSIHQTNLNLNDYVLQLENSNRTVYNHLSNLFIEQWATKLNYSQYFHNCNPSICTHTTTDILDYSYAITLFISLYGGLIIIFRFISPIFIKIVFKFKSQLIKRDFIQWIKQVNLFKDARKRTEQDIKQQKITSHVYLILFLVSIIILVLTNLLNTEIVMTKSSNPPLETYTNLQISHSDTLTCPCSTTTIPYHKFMTLSPISHQICSSDFISNEWISMALKNFIPYHNLDWRNRVYQQFSLLSKLCQLANETITRNKKEFLSQSFIVSSMISENDFNTQLNETLNQFFQSTIVQFYQFIQVVDLSIQVDQPFMIPTIAFEFEIDSFNIQFTGVDTGTMIGLVDIHILPNVIRDSNSKLIKCICSIDPHCHSSSVFFDVDVNSKWGPYANRDVSYVIPGSFLGCSNMDSLLLSNMECFYMNSSCFSTIVNYTKITYESENEYPPWPNPNTLVHNSTLTRFDRNTSISLLAKEMMLEQWNPLYSYDSFYQLCSPTYCMYAEKKQAKSKTGIFLTLISMIGGLTVSLRLVTSILISLIIRIKSKFFKKQEQQAEETTTAVVNVNRRDQLKSVIKKLFGFVVELNLFPPHYFEYDTNQMNVKRLGQLTTRLYFILLISSFTILIIYTMIQQQIQTKDFNKPSFDRYNELIDIYGEQLKCSCSSISSTYSQFVQIEPSFHPICSSSFVSDEFIDQFRMNSASNERDYRRILPAHIQYLQGLCQISVSLVTNSKEQFLSSLFLTKYLLPNDEFRRTMNSSIEYVRLSAPNLFTTISLLTRNVNFGNSIISRYETNFKYFLRSYDHMSVFESFLTESMIYDNNCSCALQANCTSQAYILGIEITGLKIGCLPSESFLLSTLECFSDISCIDTIKNSMNLIYPLEPLSLTTNQTISELLKNLFTEQWLTTLNYSSYFHRCSPSLCSYTYIQKFSLIYIISFLLGLQGGLTIVLKWICPIIIENAIKLINYRKKRSNRIHPEQSLHTIPTIASTIRIRFDSHLLKYILASVLFLMLITGLVLFSIYIVEKRMTELVVTSSTTTTTAIITTSTNTTTTSFLASNCLSTFEIKSIHSTDFIESFHPIVEDFNNDNRLDIAFFSLLLTGWTQDVEIAQLTVLLGNGDGTFGMRINFTMDYLTHTSQMIAIDTDQDHILDIAIIHTNENYITFILGNGDGSFREGTRVIVGRWSTPSAMAVGDFNGDMIVDIAFICSGDTNIFIYLGDDSGSFSTKIMIDTEEDTSPTMMTVADFNGDGRSDIAISSDSNGQRTIGVFIGYGNGSFENQKKSFSGGTTNVQYMIVGDFNGDRNQDMTIAYRNLQILKVFLGHDDGTLSETARLMLESTPEAGHVVVKDFNKDGYSDIAMVIDAPYSVIIFSGNGNGQFQNYTISFTNLYGESFSISAGDFNNDNYQDIIITYSYSMSFDIFLNTGQCNSIH